MIPEVWQDSSWGAVVEHALGTLAFCNQEQYSGMISKAHLVFGMVVGGALPVSVLFDKVSDDQVGMCHEIIHGKKEKT